MTGRFFYLLLYAAVWYNKIMEGIDKEKIIAWLRPAGFVLLVIVISLIAYLTQRGPEEKIKKEPVVEKEITEEEILKSLTAPSDAKPIYDEEQLSQILKNLSAPEDSKSSFSQDEQKRILESLSAPTK